MLVLHCTKADRIKRALLFQKYSVDKCLMKMLTQSEGPVALVSCWLGDHLFASHTVCSHTLMFSAPLVGRLGTCRELSHH